MPTNYNNWFQGAGTASVNGTITTTVTWVSDTTSDNTPPPAVLIKENCTTYWEGTSGSCSNDIGDLPVPLGRGEISTGYKISLRNTSVTSFSLSRSPDAHCIQTSTPENLRGEVGVKYSAEVFPLRARIDGLNNGKALIGQRLWAYEDWAGLNAIGGFPLSSVVLEWSVKGGNPFKSYTASHTQGTTLVNWSTSTGIGVGFSTAKNEQDVGVKLRVVVPEEFIETTVETSFQSAVPITTIDPLTIGNWHLMSSLQQPPFWVDNGVLPTRFCLWAGSWNSYNESGQQVSGASGMVIPFWIADPPNWSQQLGVFQTLQLITDRSKTKLPGQAEQYVNQQPASGLDHIYPYNASLSALPELTQSGSPRRRLFVDTPRFQDNPAANMTISQFEKLTFDADFQMFAMYQAPDTWGPSWFVPIFEQPWVVNGIANKSGGVWTIHNGVNDYPTKPQMYPAFPEWSTVINP